MSKADAALMQGKSRVTHAEAVAQAAAENNGDSGHQPATKKTRAAKKDADGNPVATTPRVKIAPGSTPAQVLAAHLGDQPTLYDHCRLVKSDKANEATAVETGNIINKLAKKVGEKAINLIRHRASPNNVQVYTRIGIDLLVKKGELTSKALTDEFLKTYKPGTARAQANQIMNLLPALKVADKTGSTLSVNDDSVILAAYRSAK